jgi:threonine/homoserine/homoserine lactone efflux protein
MTASLLVAFVLASLVFALIPGPAVIYIVTRGIEQGRGAGIISALAIETGNMIYVVTAALGLSALLASSVLAFNAVRLLGACYLIYLGVRKLLSRVSVVEAGSQVPHSKRRIYAQGVLVAVLNPKTALFFISFLPQFVDPSRGAVALQILVLGCLLTMITTIGDCCYALLSGTLGQRLRTRVWSERLRIASGSVYIGLGALAAVTGVRSSRA